LSAAKDMNYPYSGQSGHNHHPIKPSLSFGDWVSLLMREIWLMAAVFSIISLIGVAFALTFKKEYNAEARLSVLMGQEYVYSPTVGAAGEGQAPKQEQIVQSEVEIITSAQVMERVAKAIGLNRLYDPKDLIITQGPDTPERRFNIGVEALKKDVASYSTPNTTVIKLNLTNKDPQVAADALNKLIDEYLNYRREVLFEDRSKGLGGQADEFTNQLEAVQKELNNFLVSNNLADYDADKKSILDQLAATRTELWATMSRRAEAEGRYSVTNDVWGREPSQIRLSFESDNSKRLLELQQQLSELLTKYTEQSQPVQDMRRRIAALNEVLMSPQGQMSGVEKTGPNPVRDSLATDRARSGADLRAVKDREEVLKRQVNELESRAVSIAMLRPQYEEMMRRKAVLEDQVKQFASRELAADAQARLNAMSNDNIRVIERAIAPTKGKSLKKFVALGAIMFGLFCGIVAGIIRALSRSSFPTSGAVGRTLGVPVLATINR
jgi:uncharacterized protein involved in exopolysaccharide biosynthesis